MISTHPRTEKRLKSLNLDIKNNQLQFLKPFGFFDYIKLQMNAFCTVSDSGTITEETALLNLSSVTVRNMHERPEGMDQGILIMSGLKINKVINAINTIIQQREEGNNILKIVPDYENSQVSQQIVRIVLSYVDFINRTVWSKNN